MLKVSDKYIYAQKWRLYKDEGTTIVHEPAPVELIDRAQATVKQKVQD